MLMLPNDLTQNFSDLLSGKSFPDNAKVSYLKWLRFYWDFCHRYYYDPYCSDSLPLFLHKLHEKRQSELQQKQARHAVSGAVAEPDGICYPVRNVLCESGAVAPVHKTFRPGLQRTE